MVALIITKYIIPNKLWKSVIYIYTLELYIKTAITGILMAIIRSATVKAASVVYDFSLKLENLQMATKVSVFPNTLVVKHTILLTRSMVRYVEENVKESYSYFPL